MTRAASVEARPGPERDPLERLWCLAWIPGSPDVALCGTARATPGSYGLSGAASAVTVAAVTGAAAEFAAARSGAPTGRSTVPREHARLAFVSERVLRVDGAALPSSDPVTGDYLAADGRWVRLHTNFRAHRAAAARALSLAAGAGPDVVSAAVRRLPAQIVEDAVVAAGGAAAVLRSPAEWAVHPHGRHLEGAPPLEVERAGPGPRLLPPPSARPLDGIRVLDLSRVIAGPVAGRVLASHGATVLRIGAPGLEQIPQLWVDTGFGKLTASADLRDPAQARRLREAAAAADVVIQAYRPEALARRGIRPATGQVWVDLSAWGHRGPWAGRRGFDSLVQLSSGLAHPDGDGPPAALPVQALDHATGWLAALGAIGGLRRRMEEGGTWRVRVSLAATADWARTLPEPPAPGPDGGESADFIAETDSVFGRVTHVLPPGTAGGIPARWDLPPSDLGPIPPTWSDA